MHVKRGWDTKIPQSSGPPVKVGDEAVNKELGDRMERAATTASSLKVEQDSATARTIDDGQVEITASIYGQVKTINEAYLRRHLKLEEFDGITSLPNTEIFEQLALMGYVSDSARLTFQKGHFSPQWRFFIHTILHYLSPKTTAWEQLSSNIATAIICLATNRTFNFSKMIFDAMFPTQTQVADEAAFISVDADAGGASTTNIGLEAGHGSGTMHKTPTRPHDSPLPRVHTLGSDKGSLQQNKLMDLVTKWTDRVGVLENEEDLEDPSKQGWKITKIDQNPFISLVQDEGTSWIQEDAEIQGKTSADTKILLDQEEPTELVEDLGSGEKGEKEISTTNISVSTASATPKVSTAAANLVYIRRSAEKRKDKGKAIMKEDKSVQKKQEQEVVAEADQAHDIDWSDPAVLRYHALQNRSFSVAEDSEIEKELIKRPGFDFQQKSSKKRSREDSDEDNAKKQKLEDDAEKEELRDSMDVVPRDDIAIDIESLATKYLIVDWKTHVLTENMMHDVLDLHRLVQERYDTTSPEGYDLLLWGDLKILFEPNEEDEIWKNQQDYNLISWRLFDSCGIHIRLEVDQESEMEFELLRYKLVLLVLNLTLLKGFIPLIKTEDCIKIKTYAEDDVQAQIQADEDLAQRMLEEERESLSIIERARLVAELIDKRKKLQAA
ncbi:hypothetical protein Tco_1254028 [Tanacetum coccineum]